MKRRAVISGSGGVPPEEKGKSDLRRVVASLMAVLVAVTVVGWSPDAVAQAQPVTVASVDELQAAIDAAEPGGVIAVAAGEYTTSEPVSIADRSDLTISAVGTVVLRGEAGFDVVNSPGTTIEGFAFHHRAMMVVDPDSIGTRLTRNHFELGTEGTEPWLRVRGAGSLIEDNVFAHRTSGGPFVDIARPVGGAGPVTTGVDVRRNYFYDHKFAGENGGEAIRIGIETSHTLVEDNIFDECDGDPEVITVKSSDNVIRNNTVYNTRGAINLRISNRTVIEGNVLVRSGGIRVTGDDHQIRNNTIVDSPGVALAISTGNVADFVDDVCPDNGTTCYNRPDRVLIAGNVLINNRENIRGDSVRPLAPQDFTVTGNAIIAGPDTHPDRSLVTLESGDSGFNWVDNILAGGAPGDIPVGGYVLIPGGSGADAFLARQRTHHIERRLDALRPA